MKRVRRVKVLACSAPSCRADERGYNSSGCLAPAWSWMFHDDFVERFGRCPAGCGRSNARRRATAPARAGAAGERS